MKMPKEEFDKKAAEFFKQEEERAVAALQEAMHIDNAITLCVKYLEEGMLKMDMPLIGALEKLEKKKFALIEIDPDEDNEE